MTLTGNIAKTSGMEFDQLQLFWDEVQNRYSSVGPHVYFFPEVDSTNSEGKRRVEQFLKNQVQRPFPATVLLAGTQTHGKGQAGRTWLNPVANTSLLQTLLVQIPVQAQPPLTLRLGLSLWQKLSQAFPDLKLSLKAPNDLYLDDKKLGGLLVEGISQGDQHFLIVGLGLNLFSQPELEIATSLPPTASQQTGLLAATLATVLRDWLRILRSAHAELAAEEQKDLLVALNQWPLLKTAYTQIAPDGTLWDITSIK